MGGTGRILAEMLLQRGVPVRALVRTDDTRAASLRAAGAEARIMLLNPSSCAAGLLANAAWTRSHRKLSGSFHADVEAASCHQMACLGDAEHAAKPLHAPDGLLACSPFATEACSNVLLRETSLMPYLCRLSPATC
jgi:hypothetical protein